MKVDNVDANYLVKGNRYSIRNEFDNTEVGHAYLYVMGNDIHINKFGFIENIEINKNFQGMGYGKLLLEHLIEESKKLNCYKLILNVSEVNNIAKGLYEKVGFKHHDLGYRLDL